MKKLILTAAAVLVSLSVYAQGTVNFANDAGKLLRDATVGNTPVPTTAGIRVALYWAPASDPSNFQQIGAIGSVNVGTPVAGVFSHGTRSTGPETPGGTAANFQVRAWELAYGSTYEAAIAAANMNGRPAKRGVSNTFSVTTGNPGGTPATPAGALAGLTSFSVDVPEPSVIALGVIGAGALLLLRRRK